MSVFLPYGLRDGRLFHISEVEPGLACACVCPACEAPLVAKKGARNRHHFAHEAGGGCDGGLETALHLRAKEILSEQRKLRLPPVYLHNRKQPIFPAVTIPLDEVWVERRAGGLVPDLLVRSGRRWLLLEVAVYHPCPERKLRRIRKMGYAALEIDVLDLSLELEKSGSLEEHQLAWRLVNDKGHKRWLFNPRRNALEAELRRIAVRRRVYHNYDGRRHYYRVAPCPAFRRVRELNPLNRYSYAWVFQDCLHCPYALEIRYEQVYRGYREVPGKPREVWCWGDQSDILEKWLKAGR